MRVTGVPKLAQTLHADAVAGAVGGAPCEATNRVRGATICKVEPRAGAATGAFGGAPYGATR
eukprot:9381954-Pyramimonas_sp.AAC.1